MTSFAKVFIAHSIGVREARDLRVCRQKDGRQLRQVQVLQNKGIASTYSKSRWIDQALVFNTEEEAKAALRWAKTHRERHRFNQTLTDILIGIDYIASLALSPREAQP
ncbi:hypothetical protein [Xanthobacter autotrophicus]|uniref:hypothetical protein n=1 Tax=Xanthobacter autotrophicus TaxID=280 RepID=UPI00372CE677